TVNVNVSADATASGLPAEYPGGQVARGGLGLDLNLGLGQAAGQHQHGKADGGRLEFREGHGGGFE
ncbi:MAG: hypothetical protein EOP39_28165, partial [Rubrivivax sp.]